MIEFFVPGIPVPKGSAKAFFNRHAQKIIVMQDNRERQKPWASLISLYAQRKIAQLLEGPVAINLIFHMPRPKAHFGKGGLKAGAPSFHSVKPDLDKLERAVLDALTSIIWRDDSQVAMLSGAKIYSDQPGVKVTIRRAGEADG